MQSLSADMLFGVTVFLSVGDCRGLSRVSRSMYEDVTLAIAIRRKQAELCLQAATEALASDDLNDVTLCKDLLSRSIVMYDELQWPWYWLVVLLTMENRTTEAIETASGYLDNCGGCTFVTLLISATRSRALGCDEECIELLQQAAMWKTDSAVMHFDIAYAYQGMYEFSEAVYHYNQALVLCHLRPFAALTNRAVCHLCMHDNARAKSDVTFVRVQWPQYYRAKVVEAIVCDNCGESSRSHELLTSIINTHRDVLRPVDVSELYLRRATLFHPHDQEADLRQALFVYMPNLEAAQRLAGIYARTQRDGVSFYERWMATISDDDCAGGIEHQIDVREYRAFLLASDGRYEEAIRDLKFCRQICLESDRCRGIQNLIDMCNEQRALVIG